MAASGFPLQCEACSQPLRVGTAWHWGLSAVALASFAASAASSASWRSWWPYLSCALAMAGFLACTAAFAAPRARVTRWKYELLVAWIALGVFAATLAMLVRLLRGWA